MQIGTFGFPKKYEKTQKSKSTKKRKTNYYYIVTIKWESVKYVMVRIKKTPKC